MSCYDVTIVTDDDSKMPGFVVDDRPIDDSISPIFADRLSFSQQLEDELKCEAAVFCHQFDVFGHTCSPCLFVRVCRVRRSAVVTRSSRGFPDARAYLQTHK